jgi:hypothetical protein
MTTSSLKTLAAIAISTIGCVSFAQQASDANAAGASSGYPSQAVDPATGAPTRADVDRSSPGYLSTDTPSRSHYNNRSCSGLSDRQSERACQQGFPTGHAATPNSMSSDFGGPTDDQAD